MTQNLDEILKMGKCQIKPNLTTTRYHTTRHDYTTKVVVVGCGGTGGRTIPLIAQHIANHNKNIRNSNVYRQKAYLKHEIGLILIDNDDIEPKNLQRQHFFEFDLGKYKAEVLAKRYSALYGMDIQFYNTLYTEAGVFDKGYNTANAIIFDHTDNKAARKSIETNLFATNNVIISTGNEDDFGQVMFSSISNPRNYDRTKTLLEEIKEIYYCLEGGNSFKKLHTIKTVPTLLELHRDFKDTKTASCVEIVLANEQSMPINNLVATLAYNMFYEVISGLPINYNSCKCNIGNMYSTNLISNPKNALKLMFKGLTGFDNFAENEEAFKDMYKLVNSWRSTSSCSELLSLMEKHTVFSIPYIELYIKINYGLASADLIKLNDKLKELKSKRDIFFGVEDAII